MEKAIDLTALDEPAKPITRITVERVNWDAVSPIVSTWISFYPSLKAVTAAIIHAALTCDLDSECGLTLEGYNSFIQTLLGRNIGSRYQSPGNGGIFVDEEGKRIVWFESYMRGRELRVHQTDYGWRCDFGFGEGSIYAAGRLLRVATNSDYGYVVAYSCSGSVVAQSNFLIVAPPPREGWAWLPSHLIEEAGYLLDHLGNSLPEVKSLIVSALFDRAKRDQDAALAALARAAE